MGKQYDNTNRGALFRNDRKENDNHPDLSGQINVNGTDYWLSGWTKRDGDGKFKVLSLSVKPKEKKPDDSRKSPPNPINEQANDFVDDDIPF